MSKGIIKGVAAVLGGAALLKPEISGKIASIAAAIPGPHQPFAAAFATAANILAQITAPKPVARGSVNEVIVDAEPPRPYIMGEA